MNFNYCPNCGHVLTHTALTSYPSILVVECNRCGWMMREGRSPSWNMASNSTEGVQINWQPQEDITRAEYDFDSTPRVPPEHKMLKEEKVMRAVTGRTEYALVQATASLRSNVPTLTPKRRRKRVIFRAPIGKRQRGDENDYRYGLLQGLS